MIGILLVSTNRYEQFIKPLLSQIDRFFLPLEEMKIFLFTDKPFEYKQDDYDFPIQQFEILSYKFPEATMLRYRCFNRHLEEIKKCSHLFYSDIDMAIVAPVSTEILGDGLTAVIHPGFFNGGGSWETRPESMCYVEPNKRKKYYAGGFQGGESATYIKAIKTMAAWIDTDLGKGITPIWHDESAWNKYLSQQKSFIELDSGYCLVEQNHLRSAWGISHLEPKIIALSKNHKEIRQ